MPKALTNTGPACRFLAAGRALGPQRGTPFGLAYGTGRTRTMRLAAALLAPPAERCPPRARGKPDQRVGGPPLVGPFKFHVSAEHSAPHKKTPQPGGLPDWGSSFPTQPFG